MDLATVLTLSVTVLLALTGYAWTYRNNIRIDQRKARLERVNRQLSEFYGPLFALSAASHIAWQGYESRFRQRFPPSSGSYPQAEPPTEEEAAMWRLWVTEVFMPLILSMQQVIIEKVDLLEEAELPESMVYLYAHVQGYRIVLKQWEMGDFSETSSVVAYPLGFDEYTKKAYAERKKEQQRLLGLLNSN